MKSLLLRAPLVCLLLSLLSFNLLFLSPEVVWAGFPPLHWLALEAPLLVGLLALIPANGWRRWLTPLATLAGLLIAAGAIGDALTQAMQGRSLNLYTDLKLLPILIELFVANLGLAWVLAGGVALGLVIFASALVLNALLGSFHARNTPKSLSITLITLSVLGLIGLNSLSQASRDGWMGRVTQPAVEFVQFEWNRALETRAALASFGDVLNDDSTSFTAPGGESLPGLADIDVILGFIESYGVAAIERDPFQDTIRPRLHQWEQALADQNLAMVTARLTAATLGGQSWLNHATFLSGLPVTSQLRFELMINSGRSTLIDDMRASGHVTRAVMPGITRDWPEGRLYGYDTIHAADSMAYQGPPMGWASMPDQFVWQRVADYGRKDSQPSFTELATLSSHAPWSPVIELVDWSAIEDGKIFSRWEGPGADYASLWQDTSAMRANYAPAIDYALQAASGFAERYVGDDTLLIVLGDHQAAPSIIGANPGRDVPIHVISGDPALLQGFLAHGFRPGAFPPGPEAAIEMADMRALLHELFGEENLAERDQDASARGG